MGPMAHRLGLDLVRVADIESSLRGAFAESYLANVFTSFEVAACRTRSGLDPKRLAGRFAVKEAVLKVLDAAEEGISPTAIELRSGEEGLTIHLSGRAAEVAAGSGIRQWSVSLAGDDELAIAWVAATVDDPAGAAPPSPPGPADVQLGAARSRRGNSTRA